MVPEALPTIVIDSLVRKVGRKIYTKAALHQKCVFLGRYSVGIFDNPYYREQTFTLGLRPETAYGCAFDFLMYPQSQAGFIKWLHAVLSLRCDVLCMHCAASGCSQHIHICQLALMLMAHREASPCRVPEILFSNVV